jgi:hypothetical protein
MIVLTALFCYNGCWYSFISCYRRSGWWHSSHFGDVPIADIFMNVSLFFFFFFQESNNIRCFPIETNFCFNSWWEKFTSVTDVSNVCGSHNLYPLIICETNRCGLAHFYSAEQHGAEISRVYVSCRCSLQLYFHCGPYWNITEHGKQRKYWFPPIIVGIGVWSWHVFPVAWEEWSWPFVFQTS